jgi:hypothetical protein
VAAALTAFVREEGKRGQQTPQPAAPAPQFAVGHPRTGAARDLGADTALAAVTPPILIALRI